MHIVTMEDKQNKQERHLYDVPCGQTFTGPAEVAAADVKAHRLACKVCGECHDTGIMTVYRNGLIHRPMRNYPRDDDGLSKSFTLLVFRSGVIPSRAITQHIMFGELVRDTAKPEFYRLPA